MTVDNSRSRFTKEQLNFVIALFNDICNSPEKLEAFRGYFSIRKKLNSAGINRFQAQRIMFYFYKNKMFKEILEKFKCSYSPIEFSWIEYLRIILTKEDITPL